MARLASAALAGAAALALLVTGVPALAQPPATHPEKIEYARWASWSEWRSGTADGVFTIPGWRTGVVIGRPAGTTTYPDPHTGVTRTWEYATWTAPAHTVPFGATELVASWNARTPAGTWIAVEMQGTYSDGRRSPWYMLGRWASGDADIKRTSVDGQGDGTSSIATDTFAIDKPEDGVLLAGYQLRLTLYRAPGSHATPRVWMLGAMASHVPDRFTVTPSAGHIAWGRELPVPRYSQNIHKGEYPEYDGGGEAWCSPTSTEMVVEYHGFRPAPGDLAWVDPAYADPQVDQAARSAYDHQYQGAGNWPFNAAYAASYLGLDAIVTRLHSLDEVERFVAAGLPVVTSQSFRPDELDGAGYGTSGHLFVVVGFTATGDVIVNDPASPSDPAVRHVYQRSQFEQIWLRTKRYRANGTVAGGSGGIAYLIKPFWRPWPPGAGNW